MTVTVMIGGACGFTTLFLVWELICGVVRPGVVASVANSLKTIYRPTTAGTTVSTYRRLQLMALTAVALGLTISVLVSVTAGVLALVLSPVAGTVAQRWQTARHRLRLSASAPAMARSIGDRVAIGYSLRGAVHESISALTGFPRRRLAPLAARIEFGATTEEVLLCLECECSAFHWLASVMRVAQRTGGNLGHVLRLCSETLEEQSALERELRSTTAQVRLTAWIVTLLPIVAFLLAELVSHGYVLALVTNPIGRFCIFAAAGLQATAVIAIWRITRRAL